MIPRGDEVIQTVSQESSRTTARSSSSENSSGAASEKSVVSETEETDNDTGSSEAADSSIDNTVNEASDAGEYSRDEGLYDYDTTEPDIPETAVSEDDSIEESEEEINSEDEEEEDKPTLEEFLSGLRCSGCRHNCSLLSPRCMNGARKASQAESEYYETYGG